MGKAKRGKRYQEEVKKIPSEPVELGKAVEVVKGLKTAKFDQTVECVMKLGIEPKKADQMIRGSVSLPNGIGKQKKVIAFCPDEEVEAAKAAGAVEAGGDELVKKITDGWMDFDVAIASPKVMSKVGKLGRVLGPQGKMPSPKNGTVTNDIENAVSEFSAGKIEFRNDAGGNVHAVVGKQSFGTKELTENAAAFVELIKKMKPASSKGTYIKQMYLSAAMSPSVAVKV